MRLSLSTLLQMSKELRTFNGQVTKKTKPTLRRAVSGFN